MYKVFFTAWLRNNVKLYTVTQGSKSAVSKHNCVWYIILRLLKFQFCVRAFYYDDFVRCQVAQWSQERNPILK